MLESAEVIKNIRRGYLFELERSARKDLNRCMFTDAMREQFFALGYSLSENVSIKRLVKDQEWLIIDGDQEFSVAKEQNAMVFCDLTKVMTQRALAKTLGFTQGTIANLERGEKNLTKDIADALVTELWLNDKQADVVMIASAHDAAVRIKEQFDNSMIKLKRHYGEYPQVMLYLAEEFG